MAIIKAPRKKSASVKPVKNIVSVEKETSVYDLIIRWCLYILAFLTPVFFLPITSDQLELPKVLLFYSLILIAAVSWAAKMVVKKKLYFVHSFLDLPIIIFGIVYFASFVFSVNRYNSLVGSPGYFSESLITVLFFILFYFLIINNVRNARGILILAILPLISLLVAIIFNFFQLFGLHLLPWSVAKAVNFDLISGSPAILAIILSSILPIILCLLIALKQRIYKLLLAALTILDVILIFFIDSGVALISLIIGLFLLIVFFAFRAKDTHPKWLVFPTLILALSMVVIFIPVGKWTGVNITNEINLPIKVSGQIAKSAIINSPLLGVGPENFSFVFGKYKPADFNQTDLWNVSFNRATNFWLNIAVSSGALGALTLLFVCVWYIVYFVKKLLRKTTNKQSDYNWYLGLGIFVSWLILFIGSWFYYLSFAALFLFWLFLALGVTLAMSSEEKSATKAETGTTANILAFSYSLFFSLLIIFSICFVYFAGRYLAADIYFTRAINNLSEPLKNTEDNLKIAEAGTKLDSAKDSLLRVIGLNPYEQDYYFVAAKVILAKIQLVKQDENEAQELNSLIVELKDNIDAGLNLDKNSYQAYFAAISLYNELRNIIGVGQIDSLILDLYAKAIAVDPNDPQYYLGRGQIYWTENQITLNNLAKSSDENEKTKLRGESSNLLNLAEADFNRVVSLKSNLVDGHYDLALVLEAKGDKTGAIAELLQLLRIAPADYNTLYNLGRIYLENNNLDEAINVLMRTISLYPKDSNGHWQLSVAYEKKGEIDKAIAEMKIVVDLNPGNETAANKLKDLEKKVPRPK
jgi:tetratricopeptide (TPR) repeat protein